MGEPMVSSAASVNHICRSQTNLQNKQTSKFHSFWLSLQVFLQLGDDVRNDNWPDDNYLNDNWPLGQLGQDIDLGQ